LIQEEWHFGRYSLWVISSRPKVRIFKSFFLSWGLIQNSPYFWQVAIRNWVLKTGTVWFDCFVMNRLSKSICIFSYKIWSELWDSIQWINSLLSFWFDWFILLYIVLTWSGVDLLFDRFCWIIRIYLFYYFTYWIHKRCSPNIFIVFYFI